MRIELTTAAAALPDAWRSQLVGRVGNARLKLLRMDGQPYPDEVHDFPEGLLVLDGCCRLSVRGESTPIHAGQLVIVPAGTPHAVDEGSHGTLLIIDLASPDSGVPTA